MAIRDQIDEIQALIAKGQQALAEGTGVNDIVEALRQAELELLESVGMPTDAGASATSTAAAQPIPQSIISSPDTMLSAAAGGAGREPSILAQRQETGLLPYAPVAAPPAPRPYTSLPVGSGISEQMVERMGALRQEMGLPEEYYTPEIPGFFERFGNQLARGVVGGNVRRTPAARFKELTIQEIYDNPEWAEAFSNLTDEEKMLVLFDGSDKAVDLVAAPQAVYDRLMGSTGITKYGDLLVQSERAPLGGRIAAPRGVASAAGEPVAAGAPTSAGRARLAAGGPAAGAPGRELVRTPKYAATVVGDVGKKDLYTVRTGEHPNYELGDLVPMTQTEASGPLSRGWIAPTGDKPEDVEWYADLTTRRDDGSYERVAMPNRVYRSQPPERQQQLLALTGEVVDTLDPQGRRRITPRAIAAREGALAPAPVQPVLMGGKEGYLTAGQISARPFADVGPTVTKSHVTTAKEAQQAVKVPKMMMQSMSLLDIMHRAPPRAFGIAGGIAITMDTLFKYFNMDETGQSIFNAIIGGEGLTSTQINQAEKELIALATGRKETLLNDRGRMSNQDFEVLVGMNSANRMFSNPEMIANSIQKFAGFEIVYDDALRAFEDKPRLYPTRTAEEYSATIDKLMSYRFDEAHARWIAQNLWMASREVKKGK